MKRRIISLVVFLTFLLMMTTVLAAPGDDAKAAKMKVAIVPFINSTEETKDYIGQTINDKFKEEFSNNKFEMIPNDKIQPVLAANSFDVTNKELPESDLLMKIAQETESDYVIAMEVLHFINSRHLSYFSTSAKSEVKARYKVYSKSTNKVTVFQVLGKGNNKVTSIGVPGIGTAMKRGIVQAMDEAYVKIQTL